MPIVLEWDLTYPPSDRELHNVGIFFSIRSFLVLEDLGLEDWTACFGFSKQRNLLLAQFGTFSNYAFEEGVEEILTSTFSACC